MRCMPNTDSSRRASSAALVLLAGKVAFNNGATTVPPGPMDQVTEADFDDEIAQAAAWLLSDRASYVTGTVLPSTGGMQAA